MKIRLTLALLFLTTQIFAGPFVLETPSMIQQLNEMVRPKGFVKKAVLFYESSSLNLPERNVLQESYYNITGTLEHVMFRSMDSDRDVIECTTLYEYKDGILSRVRGFWGNEEVSSTGFLLVSDSSYSMGQNIVKGFSEIYQLTDGLGNLHFEFFSPSNFRGGSLVTNVNVSDDSWDREVFSPTTENRSKFTYYNIDVSKDDASWEFLFSDEIYGLVHRLLVEYGEYGPNCILVFHDNGQIWEESFNYFEFDSMGNWTQVVKNTPLGEWKYYREIEYY